MFFSMFFRWTNVGKYLRALYSFYVGKSSFCVKVLNGDLYELLFEYPKLIFSFAS